MTNTNMMDAGKALIRKSAIVVVPVGILGMFVLGMLTPQTEAFPENGTDILYIRTEQGRLEQQLMKKKTESTAIQENANQIRAQVAEKETSAQNLLNAEPVKK